MVKQIIFILSLLIILQNGITLNILGIFPHPAISHFKVFQPLLKELARKGYNLTIISPFPLKEQINGYHDISLEKDTEIMMNAVAMDAFKNSIYKYYTSPFFVAKISHDICSKLKSKTMLDFLKTDVNFDLIIAEIFCNDCFLGFMHKYKVPVIGLSSTMILPFNNVLFGNPVNPSFIPSPFLPFTHEMNFWQRLENTINYIYTELIYKYMIEQPGHEVAKAYFGNDLPPLVELQKNITLLLVNSHFTYSFPRPFLPSVIEVGGMFLGKPQKLPDIYEKYLTNSKHGVIYFSMGSMLNGSSFSDQHKNAFLKSFSKLKQRVLWKYEIDVLPNKPDNVMIEKWLPQYDILCHPNVIGFISHGGLVGTTEGVHCGVPMIIIPRYGDQFTNAKNLEAKGIGIPIYLEEITEDVLTDAFNKILDSKFQERAKQFSREYKDRLEDPLKTAIYWVEYVIRHKGAPQMKSSAIHLPLYQYLLLDVAAFILTIFLIICYITRYCLKLLFKKNEDKVKTN